MLVASLAAAVMFPDRSPPATVLIALTALAATGLKTFAETSRQLVRAEAKRCGSEPLLR